MSVFFFCVHTNCDNHMTTQYSFAELERLVNRIPLTGENIYVFEELLKQTYDVYRPIMDMLFDGTIVVEDLMPGGTIPTARAEEDNNLAAERKKLTAWDFSPESMRERCKAILAGGSGNMAVVQRDNTALLANADGTPSAAYVPAGETVVGADSSVSTPNSIEVSRAGSEVDAQKNMQEAYRAVQQTSIA